jgi:hypothetical protein
MTDIWFHLSIGGRADALRPSALQHMSLTTLASQGPKRADVADKPHIIGDSYCRAKVT